MEVANLRTRTGVYGKSSLHHFFSFLLGVSRFLGWSELPYMFSSVEKAEKADQVVKIKVLIGNGRGMRPWGAKQKSTTSQTYINKSQF